MRIVTTQTKVDDGVGGRGIGRALVAGLPEEGVVTRAAKQLVITWAANKYIITIGTGEGIGAVGTDLDMDAVIGLVGIAVCFSVDISSDRPWAVISIRLDSKDQAFHFCFGQSPDDDVIAINVVVDRITLSINQVLDVIDIDIVQGEGDVALKIVHVIGIQQGIDFQLVFGG